MIELVQAAPPLCFPHAELAAHLARGFDEHPVGNGLADGNAAMILYVSRDGSSWTLVIRRQQVACIALTGKDWSGVESPKQPQRGI